MRIKADEMEPRERVLSALNHEEPDKVPFHFLQGLSEQHKNALKEQYNVTEDMALWEKLEIDLPVSIHREPSEEFKRSGRGKLDKNGMYENEFGVKYRIGTTGKYWHWVYHPLQDKESVDEYDFPEIDFDTQFRQTDEIVRKYRDRYVILGGLTQWGFFNAGQILRGFNRFIRDLYENPKFAESLLDKILQFNIEEGVCLIKKGADIIVVGDDVGMQTGMLISPKLFKRYIKPRMKKLIDSLKIHGLIYFLFHSDGNIESIIPDLIEVGVDILNPVQPDCMNPSKVKEEYGYKLTLYGSISVQETLPFGSPEDVKNEVKTRIETMAYGGGLIVGAAHTIENVVPTENVIALVDAVRKYRVYPLRIYVFG